MKKTLLIFGPIPATFYIAGKLGTYYSGNQFNSAVLVITGVLGLVILFTSIFLAIKYAKQNIFDGYLSLKQAMKTGLGVALISGFTIGLFAYFFHTYVNTEYVAYTLEQNRKGMEADKLSIEEIEKNMKYLSEKVYNPFRIALSAVGFSLIIGAFSSFISSTFLLKNKPEIEEAQDQPTQ